MSENERKDLSEQETSEVSGSGFGDLFKRNQKRSTNPNDNETLEGKIPLPSNYPHKGICKKCGKYTGLNTMLNVCRPCLEEMMENTPHPPMSTE